MVLAEEKEILLRKLIDTGVLRTPRVIRAFQKVKREDFVPGKIREFPL